MRRAIFLTVFAGAIAVPGLAAALPSALGDEAAITRGLGGGAVGQVAHRTAARNHYYAARHRRRYDWSYYPYWRPYQCGYVERSIPLPHDEGD